MTSIAVERSGFGIVVAEDGDADAASLLDGLPALRAARYLTATPALRQALRAADADVVEAVRPHLDGAVVVPEDGLADEGDDGRGADSTRLAQALGVAVIAPQGRFIRCEGTLFSVGGDGWVTQSPRGAAVRMGRRYPAPAWQADLPPTVPGAAHIPAGLWVTAGTDPRHAVRLAGIGVRHRQLLLVVGSPAEPAPTHERMLDVLRALPDATRSAVVLAGFGGESLPIEVARALAAELGHPLRIAHGVELDGAPVRIDGDDASPPATFALESVCAPDGSVTLERWVAPPGLVASGGATYRLGETRGSRRRPGDRWVVHVVAAGLVVGREGEPCDDARDLEAPAGSLGLFLRCDGARRPADLPGLLEPLLRRLERDGAVAMLPLDAAARRLVRDAYPGRWAPTEALAITADGRLVAATVDASGDTPTATAEAEDVAADADEVGGDAVDPGRDAATDDAADGDALALAASDAATPDVEHEATEVAADALATGARDARAVARPVVPHAAGRGPSDARVHVDAVVGAEPAPSTSAGTREPVADDAAAAWYAAAVTRPESLPDPHERPLPSGALPQHAPAPGASEETQARDAPPLGEGMQAKASPRTASADASSPADGASSDALSRALRGSAPLRPLAGSTRAASASTTSARPEERSAPTQPAAEQRIPAPASALVPGASSAGADASAEAAPRTTSVPDPAAASPAMEVAPVDEAAEPLALDATQAPATAPAGRAIVEVPAGARSTADQRHRVRSALGSRYDVASRTVSQLLAQQPGMRVAAGDRSAMLTGLSLVRVFATAPHDDYDLDFHVCLAEGLAMLPTARSIVVRGIPAAFDAAPGSTVRLRAPLVAAAPDGPATGPSEALIWTTSGRRLDRVLHGSAGAADVVLPAGARLRVLGLATGGSRRVLLAEEGADAEQALARLQAAAEARGELGAHADDRWLGDLPLAA